MGLNRSKYACVLDLWRWDELDLRTCVQDLVVVVEKHPCFSDLNEVSAKV